MAADRKYPTPPITEAIIEFRFAVARSDDDLERYSRKLARRYPTELITENRTYQLEATSARLDSTERVRRRSNADETAVVVLTSQSLILSQTGEYPGWEAFLNRVKQEWKSFKGENGYSKIVQIGLRYINRIDVPKVGDVYPNEEYLSLHIALPSVLDPSNGYTLAIQKEFPEKNLISAINSATVISPLPEMMAFLLDIDVMRKQDVPQRDEEIFDLLEVMRTTKNDIFEACVTDEARKGFMNEVRLG